MLTDNDETKNLQLPIFNRHQFQKLIEDTLLLDNYNFFEKEDTKPKEQLVQNLVMTCLIAQEVVNKGNMSEKTLSKLVRGFNIQLFIPLEPRKVELNALPKLLQLPFLISNFPINKKEKMWAKIAIYLAIVLRHHKLKSYYLRIINRIKVACFYQTPIKTWIMTNLPDFSEEQKANLQVHQLIDFLTDLENHTGNSTRRNQAIEVRLCLEVALNPKRRKKIDKEIKRIGKKRKKRKKKSTGILSSQDFVQPIFHMNQTLNTSDDIENFQSNLQATFIEIKDFDQLANSSNEVKVDNVSEPLLYYQTPPSPAIRYSAPLQIIDLSTQQMYISQRELALNSSVYLLSPKAYQLIFAKLVKDCQLQHDKLNREELKIKTLATVLLILMLTSIPVESLITKGFVKQSGIFNILKTKVYLQADFEITERKKKFEVHIFENEKSRIELPMPIEVVGFLAKRRRLPTQHEVRDYVSQVRKDLNLPYLSVHRIESALQVILTRYIEGSNSHIADIICRIPPISAPAKFYSSHTLSELIIHYKNALIWLRQDTPFDLNFLEVKKDYSTGSSQALTLPFIKILLNNIFDQAVMKSPSKFELFNRVSSYVWLIFCLTTGIRPNNHITHVHNIDLTEDSAQIIISDKPNRKARNPRLVPICPMLVKTLMLYRIFLSKFAQFMHRKSWINQNIKPILHELEDSDSMLINLIFEEGEKISTVKRGQIAEFIKPFFEIDPYFTRHFVRVQLEKRNVEMPIINAIIGHEKHRQEFFGQYSSGCKSDIYAIADIFEAIAEDLSLIDIEYKFQKIDKLLRSLPEQAPIETAG